MRVGWNLKSMLLLTFLLTMTVTLVLAHFPRPVNPPQLRLAKTATFWEANSSPAQDAPRKAWPGDTTTPQRLRDNSDSA